MSTPYGEERKKMMRLVNEIIGANIRKHRLYYKMTQKELGAAIVGGEVTEAYLRGIETGNKFMSLVRVVEISDALGVPLAELVEGL